MTLRPAAFLGHAVSPHSMRVCVCVRARARVRVAKRRKKIHAQGGLWPASTPTDVNAYRRNTSTAKDGAGRCDGVRRYGKRELPQRLAFAGLRRVGIARTLRLVLILLR